MKIKLVFTLSLMISELIFSQENKFDFNFLEYDIDTSIVNYYGKLIVQDNRNDSSLGMIQKGAFNAKYKVIALPSLKSKIESLFEKNIPRARIYTKNELRLVINNFTMYEITKSMSERGYLAVDLKTYKQFNDSLTLLYEVDTLFEFGSLDVTKPLLKLASNTIFEVISTSIQIINSKDHRYFSLSDFLIKDSLDKLKLPLFSSEKIQEGIYMNYNSLLSLKPDYSLNQEIDTNRWSRKKSIINDSNIYAVIIDNSLFVNHERDWRKAKKVNNNWMFNSYKIEGSGPEAYMFGLLGALLFAGNNRIESKFIIDHKKGLFIPISK